ncbi:MAG: aldo/keto reductase [Defluviitaleaceae bacterium]|nr:aldo/keto reductase [Defluviitaleaceae bacterium]
MKKVRLGNTGMDVSALIFGGMIVREETPKDSARYVAEAIEHGVNYFDVAPVYGDAEVKLAPALAPYRKDVYLACKSVCRGGDIEKELHNSLKIFNTDYFDVYQLHALTTSGCVEESFASGGAMEVLLRAQKAGKIRHIGITGHGEDASIQALAYYDFATLMFPVNWSLFLEEGYGRRVLDICRHKNVGVIGMKSLTHRMWVDQEERKRFPKSWCMPIFDNNKLAIAAYRHALSVGADVLVPPGNFESYSYAHEIMEDCADAPFSNDDMSVLQDELARVRGPLLFNMNNA